MRKSALNVSHIENINSEQFNFCLLVVVSGSMLMNDTRESPNYEEQEEEENLSFHNIMWQIRLWCVSMELNVCIFVILHRRAPMYEF